MQFRLATLFLVLCMQGFAQMPVQIRFTNYTQANGLPEEYITSIIEDNRGFLWFGSREGLIRFDGEHYKIWYANPGDSNRFSSSNVTVIGEYAKDRILFQAGIELWQINIRNLQLEPLKYYQGKAFSSRPHLLKNGHWVISDLDSLYIAGRDFSPVYSISLRKYFPSNSLVSCFDLQFPYAILYGGNENRMCLLNYHTRELKPFFIDNNLLDSRTKFFVPQAYDSTKHRLYLSAYFNGTFYCDLQLPGKTNYQPVTISSQPDGTIRKSILLPDGRLMQGGDNGLYITDFTETLHYSSNTLMDNPINNKTILDIHQAKEGGFWIATVKGVSYFSLQKPQINFLSKQLGFNNDDEFKSILKGNDGNIYFLTQERSLLRFNPSKSNIKRIDSTLGYCWAAVKDGNDIIATGGFRKILRYNTTTGVSSFPDYLNRFYSTTTDLVTLVFKSANGDLWYSCNGGCGIIRNPAGTSRYIQYNKTSSPQSIELSYVHTAAEDSKGNIWWGSNKSQVLLKWDVKEEKFLQYEINKLIPGLQLRTGINNIFIDQSDNLWIALDAAAVLKYDINKKTGSYIDINKGLPSNAVASLVSDNRGRVWIGTRKGLCCYIPEGEKIVNFTSYDGFPENNFEGRGIFFDKEENLLYVGARRSLAWFNPDSFLLKTTNKKPVVFIDEMLVNGKPLYFENESKIVLGAEENNITFGLSSPEFNRNNQLLFQYRLNGTSGDWIDLEEKRTISFNDLSHGNYFLTVRCSYKGTDNWTETVFPFNFTILTPWHKTWWFKLLIVFAVVVVCWAAIRLYYRRKMEKQQSIMEKEIAIEQERTKMARELHDGLGSMLSGIKHSFAAMNKEFDLSEKQRTLFHSNLDKLNESIVELRNISHNMASDALLKYGIENSLRDYCNNTSIAAGINITYTTLNTETLKLSEEKSFHIFRIMQELLQNIIRHSGATRVMVQLSCNNKLLYITVEDDGKGFDIQAAKKQKSMGLKNIESRTKLLKGQLDYQTSPGEGTSVLITIPLD